MNNDGNDRLCFTSRNSQAALEGFDLREERFLFEIAQDFMPIQDGVHVVQGGVKERLEVVLLFAGRDARDDLIEIEIAEKKWGLQAFLGLSCLQLFRRVCCSKSW